jgi:hypothetical protein
MLRIPGLSRPTGDVHAAPWLRLAGAAVFLAFVLVYGCQMSGGRRECRAACAARGSSEFIYVPADSRSSREAECICRAGPGWEHVGRPDEREDG